MAQLTERCVSSRLTRSAMAQRRLTKMPDKGLASVSDLLAHGRQSGPASLMGGAAGRCRARSCQNDIHGAIAARFLNPAQSADLRRK